ncbi:DUF1631 family protein [Dokdonella sp.]|uniref:DUF1631 family protein n=1 Tax=Dokdonella sp. TaxID=2291710 RepID=UPI003784F76B
MATGQAGNGNRASGQERLLTIGQRADLPPRVRTLLDGLYRHAAGWFQPTITRAMTELENSLFQSAERAGNSGEQQRKFEALRAIKDGRAHVLPRFQRRIESDLAQVRRDAAAAPAPKPRGAPGSSLELVDADVLEENLGLQEIAGKADVRNSQALHAYTHRFAIIAASAVPASETVPLGPTRLTDAFRYALADIPLDVEHRLIAYRQFDRAVMLALAPFYERVNSWLAGQRVLPHLQAPAYRRPDGAHAEAPAPEAEPAATEDAADAPATPSAPAAAPGRAPYRHQEFSGPELFNTLRDLLGAKRRAEGEPLLPPDPNTQAASRDDLQSVLGALQHAPLSPTQAARYDSEHFKNTLQVKLRRASPAGSTLSLGEEDRDTVDLIGMLFDYVTRNVRDGSGARSLLTRLHVPVLRVALGDKTFFTRRDHPARELLNTIAETGTRWFDDGEESDPDLARKMQMVVDHVTSDFDGDQSVFEKLLGDLTTHMQLLARRAEVVERRHIDAARGRDRLEVARENARAAIVRVLQSTRPAPRVRTLLEQAWTDALALSAMREGQEGSEFKRRLHVAESLAQRGQTPLGTSAEDEAVQQELESGLRQVGLHDEDVRGLVDNLHAQTPTGPAADRLRKIDEALKDKPRLGGDSASTAHASAEASVPLTPQEADCLAQLKRTPFGTWFEFVKNQQGETVRRKLAWYSPLTGHCLFVNQRGARTDDFTLELLAREMARGQARIADLEQPSLMDRAWKAIIDLLRPHGDAAKAPPATAGAHA